MRVCDDSERERETRWGWQITMESPVEPALLICCLLGTSSPRFTVCVEIARGIPDPCESGDGLRPSKPRRVGSGMGGQRARASGVASATRVKESRNAARLHSRSPTRWHSPSPSSTDTRGQKSFWLVGMTFADRSCKRESGAGRARA